MNTDTAIALIGTMAYKPDWEFKPTDNTGRFEDSVKMTISYPCANSDRDYARMGYPDVEPEDRTLPSGKVAKAGTPTIRWNGKASASFLLMLSDVNDVSELYYLIARTIMEIEEHEMREFLRITPTFWSPFHPHHADGMKRWAQVTGRPLDHVYTSDTRFGLA